ncbi:hypothetical protein [Lysobacter sp. F6437]|uniref:hypothetical protein n=1 Tax=Lysobacter sp. F6437 TaxID=3459296 RepID=UPI00403DA99C
MIHSVKASVATTAVLSLLAAFATHSQDLKNRSAYASTTGDETAAADQQAPAAPETVTRPTPQASVKGHRWLKDVFVPSYQLGSASKATRVDFYEYPGSYGMRYGGNAGVKTLSAPEPTSSAPENLTNEKRTLGIGMLLPAVQSVRPVPTDKPAAPTPDTSKDDCMSCD